MQEQVVLLLVLGIQQDKNHGSVAVQNKNKLGIPQSHPTHLLTLLVSDSFYLLQPLTSVNVINLVIQHFSEE